MNRSPAAVRAVVNALEKLYGAPWPIRKYDPMEELVSCILSQHTADANSFPAFERLRSKYPTWGAIAALTQAQLAREIRQAGLANQKAKSVLASLGKIKDLHGDYTLEPLRGMSLNDARNWLTQLPGVGPKTANIVLLFGFEMPAIPVDTHVHRVSRRLGLIQKATSESRAHIELEAITPRALRRRLHVALIQHGRSVCHARKPACDKCPLTKKCDYFNEDESLRSGANDRRSPARTSPRPSARRAEARKGRAVRGR